MDIGVSAYLYVNRGEDYDFPYMEVISNVLWCDEIIVGTDPRFNDGTLQKLEQMAMLHDNIRVVAKEFDLDDVNPHGSIKQVLREECQYPWLMELDADEFVVTDGDKIREILSLMPSSHYLVGTKLVHFFNGKNNNLTMPKYRGMFSRNADDIRHSLEGKSNHHGRWGATLTSDTGVKLIPNIIPEILCYHFGWYSLKRKWRMKQTLHYYEGRQKGVYKDLADYQFDMEDPPEPVEFWGIVIDRPLEELHDATIEDVTRNRLKRIWSKIPSPMNQWCRNQYTVSSMGGLKWAIGSGSR